MTNIDVAHDPSAGGRDQHLQARTARMFNRPVHAGWNVRFPVHGLMVGVVAAMAGTVTLGILRELYVHMYGLETPLKDLGQIALDSEGTLAVWFSSVIMIAAASLLFVISALTRKLDDASSTHWLLLGILFALMSIDETVSFHETTIAPLRQFFGLDGILHFSWVVIGAPVMLILGAYFLPFLLRLPVRYAVAFATCGGLYVGGALGMEFVGGYTFTTYGGTSVAYTMAFIAEESLEMIGLTGFLIALLHYLKDRLSGHAINLAL